MYWTKVSTTPIIINSFRSFHLFCSSSVGGPLVLSSHMHGSCFSSWWLLQVIAVRFNTNSYASHMHQCKVNTVSLVLKLLHFVQVSRWARSEWLIGTTVQPFRMTSRITTALWATIKTEAVKYPALSLTPHFSKGQEETNAHLAFGTAALLASDK